MNRCLETCSTVQHRGPQALRYRVLREGVKCRPLPALRQCGTWRRPANRARSRHKIGPRRHALGGWQGGGHPAPAAARLGQTWDPCARTRRGPPRRAGRTRRPSNDLRVKCDAEHAGRRHVLEATLALAPNWKRLTAPEPFRRYSARRKLTSLTSQKPSLVQFA